MRSLILLLATIETETIADIVQKQDICCESSKNFCNAIGNGVDWSQFIPTLIATFIGFALAILGSYLYDNYKDGSERKTIISNLCNELEEMKSELSTIDRAIKQPNSITLWISPLKTYIWDSIATNNKLGLLSDCSWYKDLLFIYHTVHEYNSWHQLRTTSAISGQEYEAIEDSMSQIADTLNQKIEAILSRLNAPTEKR